MAISELSISCDRAPPSSPCIPLSQCKRLAVCRRGRLRATLSGKTAILSLERVSNILYSDEVSKYFCMEQSSALSSRMEVPSTQFSSSIGFTIVKNTDCLPRLRLCPPGINPLLTIECTSLTFLAWSMFSVNPFGNNTLSCSSGSMAISPECLWIALKYEMCLEELGFKQY